MDSILISCMTTSVIGNEISQLADSIDLSYEKSGGGLVIDQTAQTKELLFPDHAVAGPETTNPLRGPMTESADRFLAATTRIVTAWLAANSVASTALPGLIRDIHRTVINLEPNYVGENPREAQSMKSQPKPRPAVEARKSIFADYLVCLEDGKHVTMLKRHLRTAHGLTPELYRAKWGLPATYPMVAPNYAKVRSRLAKETGLGKPGRPQK